MTLFNIKNRLRLLFFLIKISVMRDMSYRFNFLVNMGTDFVYNVLKIILIEVLFSNINSLGDLSKYEVLFILGTSFIIDSFYMMFNFFNHIQISENIRRGNLDYLITKPVSSWFMLSYKQFNLAGIGNLVFGIYIVYYCLSNGRVEIINWGLYFLFLISGYFIYSSISLLIFTTAFWTIKTEGFIGVMVDMTEIMKYPHTIFPRVIQVVFTIIVPIFLIVSHPIHILLEKESIIYSIFLFSWSIIFVLIAQMVFKKALKMYESTN